MAKAQKISLAEAAALVKDGMTVMAGGFMANGTAERIVDELVKTGVKDLTIICDDADGEEKEILRPANTKVKPEVSASLFRTVR